MTQKFMMFFAKSIILWQNFKFNKISYLILSCLNVRSIKLTNKILKNCFNITMLTKWEIQISLDQHILKEKLDYNLNIKF
jgi:hypothetical protein